LTNFGGNRISGHWNEGVCLNNNDIIFHVLKYYYDDNLTQLQIAQKLNISRIAVSRLLAKARKEGLIQFKIIYPKNFFDPRVENLEKEFLRKYNLKECIIAKTQKDRTETLKELSNQLSQLFDRIVENSTLMGVGWGTTLETISRYIEVREKKDLRVTPLIGGYGKFSEGAHSNNISRIIAEKFNGTSYVINIPASFDTKEIKESILADSTTKEIFKRTKMVDLAVLCMSDLSKESSLYDRGQLNDEDINYLRKLGVIGDVNYIFVDKNGNFVPNEISDRTTTIFPISLMKTVNNVIGIAVSAKKAIILYAVLKAGLINILITDSEAANEIMELENIENYSRSL
jgi:deoxyribonucleoside regulator